MNKKFSIRNSEHKWIHHYVDCIPFERSENPGIQDLNYTRVNACRSSKKHLYAHWILAPQTEIKYVTKGIIFVDETHYFSGYMNRHRYIYTLQNLVDQKCASHCGRYIYKAISWYGFWPGGLTGTYFLESDEGDPISVKCDHYRNIAVLNKKFLWKIVSAWKTWYLDYHHLAGQNRLPDHGIQKYLTS